MQLSNGCARFKDVLAVVIGGGSGLGKAASKRLAAEGARVVVADINFEAAVGVSDSITTEGHSAIATQVDVTQQQHVKALFEGAGAGANVVVNSAGTMWQKPFSDISQSDMREAFGASVEGLVWSMQHAARALERRPQPSSLSIVNISSTTSLIAMQGVAAYSAAKAAIRMLSRSAALELAPLGIRVNTVVPHTTDTEGVQAFSASLTPEYMATVAEPNMPKLIPRIARPEEIAACIAFLASSDASFITGAELVVDGGASIT